MSRIKGRNTKPEMLVRRFLHFNGFRYKLHDKTLTGKPDIVLPKYKTVIFVHGCFWHMHKNCRYASLPENNAAYWTPKLLNNVKRDKHNSAALKEQGWKVITVWTCKLRPAKFDKTVGRLQKMLTENSNLVDNKSIAQKHIK